MNVVMVNGNEEDADSNIGADDNDEGSLKDRIDSQSPSGEVINKYFVLLNLTLLL